MRIAFTYQATTPVYAYSTMDDATSSSDLPLDLNSNPSIVTHGRLRGGRSLKREVSLMRSVLVVWSLWNVSIRGVSRALCYRRAQWCKAG